jgi:hypothetical protein
MRLRDRLERLQKRVTAEIDSPRRAITILRATVRRICAPGEDERADRSRSLRLGRPIVGGS